MATAQLGSLLLLTEDSARDAHATLKEVVKRMLRLLVPDCQTQRLGFDPKDEKTQRVVQGTGWKSSNPRQHAERTAMLRTIATKLGRADGFVFFHVDGDRAWTARATSENALQFQKLVIDRVRRLLQESKNPDVETRLGRLFLVMPFYSIEAWLYQNTKVAIRLCREKYSGRDADKFESWEQDRAALDDVERPKEQTCLESNHNLECAGSGYPAKEVFDAGRSYTSCVERLQQCPALRKILDATAGR